MFSEDEYLMLSGIQHFVFCRRQWALIHIEQQWEENFRTADGQVMHRNVHDANFHEARGDTVITRSMAVSSARLDSAGKKRLRRVAKQCVNYGVRVQNSVFECELDPAQCRFLKQKLIDEINETTDSLRFYYLGDVKKAKVEHFGSKQTIKVDEPLIF